MRLIYHSTKGGKPLNLGINHAKRIARRADRRDQLAVQRELGVGLPQQKNHHQQLVKQRHAYYADRYEEVQRASHDLEPA
jgi:hypothetical protein